MNHPTPPIPARVAFVIEKAHEMAEILRSMMPKNSENMPGISPDDENAAEVAYKMAWQMAFVSQQLLSIRQLAPGKTVTQPVEKK